MTLTDPMLGKIRKLLSKAEDPATSPAEAELYTAKATQLIADYGIDQALLAHDGASPSEIGNRLVVHEAPYAADKADLLATVAMRLGCACVQSRSYRDGSKELSTHVFGHDADLLRVEMLFTSLLVQVSVAVARVPIPPWEHKAAFRRSWMAGFRSAIGLRLREAERRAQQAAEAHRSASDTSTAVVLADRSHRVEDAMHREYPQLTRGRRRTLSGSGSASGFAAGQRADLGGTRVTGPRRRSIGTPTGS